MEGYSLGKVNETNSIIIKEIDGDLFTPISIFQLLKGSKKFLFESSLKHKNSGRYSFIGTNPSFELRGYDDYCQVIFPNKTTKTIKTKPLEYLKNLLPLKTMKQLEQLKVPFIGGAVGYIGYDVMKDDLHIERNQRDEIGLPDVHLMFYEQVIAFDHLKQKIYVIGVPLLETTSLKTIEQRVQLMIEQLNNSIQTGEVDGFSITDFQPEMSRERFIEKVNTVQKHIEAKEVSQVVLSQRLSATYEGNAFSFYRKLRLSNPSPYMFYMDFNDYILAGSSPESLVKISGQKIKTNPIAGTRPRGKTSLEDEQLIYELLNDKKEIEEHNMLVDLSKQELSSVCKEDTICLEQYLKVEKYKHVMHLVSVLSGKLKENVNEIDALKACLPAGTVSGSPKAKAMEIIHQLEETKRGVYAGAVGYLSAHGDIDFAIAIRMMVLKDQLAYAQAGAGIVVDSVPEKEYEETLHKLKSLLEIEHEEKIERSDPQ